LKKLAGVVPASLRGLNVPLGKSCQSSSGLGGEKIRLAQDTVRSPTRARPQTSLFFASPTSL
jgi:hypothetical protein